MGTSEFTPVSWHQHHWNAEVSSVQRDAGLAPTATFLPAQGSSLLPANILESWTPSSSSHSPIYLTSVLSLCKSTLHDARLLFFKGDSRSPLYTTFWPSFISFSFISCLFICLEFYLWDSNSSSGGCYISSLHSDCKDFNLVAFILSCF